MLQRNGLRRDPPTQERARWDTWAGLTMWYINANFKRDNDHT